MKKAGVCILFFILAGVVFAWAGQKGAEKITLDGGRLGNVHLPHWKHKVSLNEDCNLCHKLFAQKQQVIAEMKKQGSLKKKQVMDQCVDCHKERKAASKTAGPVSCKACHIK